MVYLGSMGTFSDTEIFDDSVFVKYFKAEYEGGELVPFVFIADEA